ncbi:MAG TPA: hypothetical protein VFR37_22730 [Longimicrobium sp.]|nr:hypothetical protein [Longimicrobium sp.]
MNEEEWTAADDVVEETWEVRRRLWARFGNDPHKYAAYIQELHQQLVREGWKTTTRRR